VVPLSSDIRLSDGLGVEENFKCAI